MTNVLATPPSKPAFATASDDYNWSEISHETHRIMQDANNRLPEELRLSEEDFTGLYQAYINRGQHELATHQSANFIAAHHGALTEIVADEKIAPKYKAHYQVALAGLDVLMDRLGVTIKDNEAHFAAADAMQSFAMTEIEAAQSADGMAQYKSSTRRSAIVAGAGLGLGVGAATVAGIFAPSQVMAPSEPNVRVILQHPAEALAEAVDHTQQLKDLNAEKAGVQAAFQDAAHLFLKSVGGMTDSASLNNAKELIMGYLNLGADDAGNISVAAAKILNDAKLGVEFKPGMNVEAFPSAVLDEAAQRRITKAIVDNAMGELTKLFNKHGIAFDKMSACEELAIVSLYSHSPELIGEKMIGAIKSGDKKAVADEIRHHNNPTGNKVVAARRNAEADMWSGEVTRTLNNWLDRPLSDIEIQRHTRAASNDQANPYQVVYEGDKTALAKAGQER